jgi:hypothetical protein
MRGWILLQVTGVRFIFRRTFHVFDMTRSNRNKVLQLAGTRSRGGIRTHVFAQDPGTLVELLSSLYTTRRACQAIVEP